MPTVLWTGKLSLPMKLMINTNNVLAWLTGNARDAIAMKQRIRQGYEGVFSDHVTGYDELGTEFQTKAAMAQLEELNLQGKEVLDVGCGTGIMSLLALRKGASKVICGDISEYMLKLGREKAADQGYGSDLIEFRNLDAESLPFGDASFDVVMTGMTLGLLPDQARAVKEIARVLRPGGQASVGAHGPEHYWEACDAYFRAVDKRYVLGYRLEYWPRKEKEVRHLLEQAGLVDIRTCRFIWRNSFENGGKAYDFFAAISSSWWYAKFPREKIAEESRMTRNYFERKKVTQITDDVILVYGRKPRDVA